MNYKNKMFETDIAYFEKINPNIIRKTFKANYIYLIDRNKNELKKLKKIESEDIIRLIKFSTKDNYLEYEYFQSSNLAEFLKSNNKITFSKLYQILKSI